jgi:hypothetical protein
VRAGARGPPGRTVCGIEDVSSLATETEPEVCRCADGALEKLMGSRCICFEVSGKLICSETLGLLPIVGTCLGPYSLRSLRIMHDDSLKYSFDTLQTSFRACIFSSSPFQLCTLLFLGTCFLQGYHDFWSRRCITNPRKAFFCVSANTKWPAACGMRSWSEVLPTLQLYMAASADSNSMRPWSSRLFHQLETS